MSTLGIALLGLARGFCVFDKGTGIGIWGGGIKRGSPEMGHYIGYRAWSPYMRQA